MNANTKRFQSLASQSRRAITVPDFDSVETRALIRALWARRWQVLGLPLGVGLLVWLIMQQVTPTYTVYSKLMLDVRKVQIVGQNEVVADVHPSEQIVNSEIAVLRSNGVIEKMLAGLTPEQRDALDPAMQPVPLATRVKTLLKRIFSGAPRALTPDEIAAARLTRVVDSVRAMRTAYAEPDSFVMTIRVDDSDPRLARDIVNGLANAYIELQRENRRDAVGRATIWLEQRLDELKVQVEQAERAVAEFQGERLIQDGGTLENVSQQLANLNNTLALTRAARVEAEARLAQLTDALENENYDAAAHIVDTPNMLDLAAQQLDLLQKDAVWARTFNENHPRRVETRTKLEEIRAAMRVEFENAIAVQRSEVTVQKTSEAGLAESIKALEGRVIQMSGSELGLRQLNREADAARQTYESFLMRVAEARAQKELQQADAVVVELAALPEAPSRPRPTLLAALGLTAALAGVVAWVLLSELSPKTFRSARELSAGLGVPVLAALPMESWSDSGEMLDHLDLDAYTTFAERIRQLRAALSLHIAKAGRGQSVLMLASEPGEGKTTTALALAKIMSLAGHRVIIVDCDLRRPKVLPSLGITRKRGRDFADFIDGNCALPDAIYKPDDQVFDILGTARRRQSAADGLSVAWLGPVLRELEKTYDFVVVDSPALLAVPDALVVAQEVDSCFYVVECARTSRAAVRRGLAMLDEMGVEVRGMILNKVPLGGDEGTMEKVYGYAY